MGQNLFRTGLFRPFLLARSQRAGTGSSVPWSLAPDPSEHVCDTRVRRMLLPLPQEREWNLQPSPARVKSSLLGAGPGTDPAPCGHQVTALFWIVHKSRDNKVELK